MLVFLSDPSWIRTASAICSPTGYTGFRLVSGSWKIMAIWLPRMLRMVGSSWPNRSSVEPSCIFSSTRPRVIFARVPISTSLMIERAVTDLPEPDSPTTPSVSPGSMVKPTESTAVNSSKVTVRSVTDRRGISALGASG